MSKDPIPSTRPYLIRALHEWCTDHGFSPYLAVRVDDSVKVPREHVKNHEIVLNVSYDATGQLLLGNEFIEFKARFGGVAREIMIPVDHVVAIYARENGQGMAFPAPPAPESGNLSAVPASAAPAAQADLVPEHSAEAPGRQDSDGSQQGKDHGKGLQLVSNHPADPGVGAGAGEAGGAKTDTAHENDTPEPPTDPSGPPHGRPTLTRVK